MKENIKYEDAERFEDKSMFKRKAKVIGYIAKEGAKIQLKDSATYAVVLGTAIVQKAVFKRDLPTSVVTGVMTLTGLVGINIVKNLKHNMETIKKA